MRLVAKRGTTELNEIGIFLFSCTIAPSFGLESIPYCYIVIDSLELLLVHAIPFLRKNFSGLIPIEQICNHIFIFWGVVFLFILDIKSIKQKLQFIFLILMFNIDSHSMLFI